MPLTSLVQTIRYCLVSSNHSLYSLRLLPLIDFCLKFIRDFYDDAVTDITCSCVTTIAIAAGKDNGITDLVDVFNTKRSQPHF